MTAESMREGRITPVHPADARAGLREAGLRRAEADRARAEAMHDIATWIPRGQEAGLTVTEIARLAGVTRQTVYDLTGDGNGAR